MGNTAFFPKSDERVKEIKIWSKPVPLNIINKVRKSICKIIIKNKGNIPSYGTGFFMKISKSLKFIFTNYHVINKDLINDYIELEIYNKKNMLINLKQCNIKYFEKQDVTIIEIKEEDKIYKDIKFLDYDSNYKEKGYNIYEGVDVFSLEHPSGGNVSCASGKILYTDNYEFTHSISTESGSSGSPIILLNNNINLIFVIGIHKSANINQKINYGTFIGEIINEIKNDSHYFQKRKKSNKKVKEVKEADLTKAKPNLMKISKDREMLISNKEIEDFKHEKLGRLMAPILNSKLFAKEMIDRVNDLKDNNYLKFRQFDDTLQVKVTKSVDLENNGNDKNINNENNTKRLKD